MAITSIQRDYGPNASIVRIVTNDDLENIVLGGWLATQAESIIEANNGEFTWKDNDTVLVSYPTGLINGFTGREIQASILMNVFPSFLSLNPISPVYPNNQSAVAHPGGGQALATQVNPGINILLVVATAGDSFILPNDVLGQTVILVNRGAQTAAIFPFVGDKINGGAVDASINIAAGATVMFIGTSRLEWNTI